MGPVWEKSTHIYLSEKQFLHLFYINGYVLSPSPFDGTGKVQTDREMQVIALKI